MTRENVHNFLIKLCDEGSETMYWYGFDWFSKNLLPNLNVADKLLEEEFELLSDSWCVLGDIYDYNNAPLKAIHAYNKASFLDPENPAAFQEMAVLQYAVGSYEDALKNINTALKLHPSDKDIIDDKAEIEDAIKTKEEVIDIADDIIWNMNEQLADFKFDEVIASLAGTKEMEELKLIARAYGAMADTTNYLKTWRTIASKKVEFEINYADWFYMPKSIQQGSEIWQLFSDANDYIMPDSVFLHLESLYENYGNELTEKKSRALICELYMLKAAKDNEKIQELKFVFPKWKELKRY
jgi:tetratricopeptide (TPR) repeat protein